MGWNIPENKTVEVRKNFPQDPTWDKFVHIYCSKNRKSFNRIPKQYQLCMEKFLGKVIGEFVCDRLDVTYPILIPNTDVALYTNEWVLGSKVEDACLALKDISEYGKGKPLYGWHISDLAVYDTPKKLSAFSKVCSSAPDAKCYPENCERCPWNAITRPPQNWCYAQNWCRKTQGA